jgi:outer membrane lipopolysaccharide assembly protein LptE/RlpB
VLITSGCGYTLVGQGSLPDHIKTIAIPVFKNDTLQEGIQETVTNAVIEEYIRGGKVRLVSEAQADAVLRGTIINYDNTQAVTFNDNNEVTTYKLIVDVDAELEDRVNDEIIWSAEALREDADFEGGPNVSVTEQQNNEDDALRRLSDELGQSIRALSTEGF